MIQVGSGAVSKAKPACFDVVDLKRRVPEWSASLQMESEFVAVFPAPVFEPIVPTPLASRPVRLHRVGGFPGQVQPDLVRPTFPGARVLASNRPGDLAE